MHVAVDDSAQMLNIFRLLGVRRQDTICGCELQTSRNIVDVGLMALVGPRCPQAGAPLEGTQTEYRLRYMYFADCAAKVSTRINCVH